MNPPTTTSARVSVLVPTRNRPELLKRCLESVEAQNHAVIAEIIVGDDSDPEYFESNSAVIADSGLSALIAHQKHVPPLGNYPNQIALGHAATSRYMLILHDDDQLLEGALELLLSAADADDVPDSKVAAWFGGNLLVRADGLRDYEATAALDLHYGRPATPTTLPMWQWCLTHAVPPDGVLFLTAAYCHHAHGPHDGSVGDWGLTIRLANAGYEAHYVGTLVSTYQEHPGSMTSVDGLDSDLMLALSKSLSVPEAFRGEQQRMVSNFAGAAINRLVRTYRTRNAWSVATSGDWRLRDVLTRRGLKTLMLLFAPWIHPRRSRNYKKFDQVPLT